MASILFTQCLQNDFVEPIDRYDPLPNLLHVGYSEAMRLLGERTEEGPVHTIMDWAYGLPPDKLQIIHIRDWHDAINPAQRDHLQQFGPHCIQNTHGADFVFRQAITDANRHVVVNASGLNDFMDTDLEQILAAHGKAGPVRVGLAGVWTEAKITFLAYDLRTRYPDFEIAVCSALTASSSRAMHFIALDQLRGLLGVQVFSSVGDFAMFLAGTLPSPRRVHHLRLDNDHLRFDGGYQVSGNDREICAYLFRDCKEVRLKCLDGGFSGNVVVKANGVDVLGHTQVPTVIKIGARDLIAEERAAFERIQEVMGNNAPSIVDFAEIADRGGIKYRYAAMLEGNVRTFQDVYAEADTAKICGLLDVIYVRQLGRLYDARKFEKLNLLNYYDFGSKYAIGVRRRVEALTGKPQAGEELEIIPGVSVPNVCLFYERDLDQLRESSAASHFTAYLHGDLNGRNIIIDGQDNVWLIDFFHTHSGHILRDFLKMENDILYIFTKIETEAELKKAMALTRSLIGVPDMGRDPEPDGAETWAGHPALEKAFQVITHLRRIAREYIETDRDPYQLYVGLLRYAVHTLGFDESSAWQRKWALYTGALCADRVRRAIVDAKRLRIDFLEAKPGAGRVGITILPGRKDRERNLADDLKTMKEAGIRSVVCLVTEKELSDYGVPELRQAYADAGFSSRFFPIADQGVPNHDDVRPLLEWMKGEVSQGRDTLVHCVGGLGRSGMIGAAYLVVAEGAMPSEAVALVRQARSGRAIETKGQEDFVFGF